jgi:hypothetical protein
LSIKRYVFIVAFGRSGSTILQKIIGAAPGFYIAGENQDALLGLYDSCRSVAHAKQKFGGSVTTSSHPWYGAERLDPVQYARKLCGLFIEEVIRPPAEAEVIGFKEIRYFENPKLLNDYLGFMKHSFHPAQFVFSTRNPEAVANSSWWKERPKETVIGMIRNFEALTDQFASANPEICFKIRYEDFTTNIETLMQLLKFLKADLPRDAVQEILATKLKH